MVPCYCVVEVNLTSRQVKSYLDNFSFVYFFLGHSSEFQLESSSVQLRYKCFLVQIRGGGHSASDHVLTTPESFM